MQAAPALFAGLALATVSALSGCQPRDMDNAHRTPAQAEALPRERLVAPDRPQQAPSGGFQARFVAGPPQGSVKTWLVVVADSAGTEVFRDSQPYSARHAVAAIWLSTADQLWVLSSDVGMAKVDRDAAGRWHKTTITPETLASVPPEIARWQR